MYALNEIDFYSLLIATATIVTKCFSNYYRYFHLFITKCS